MNTISMFAWPFFNIKHERVSCEARAKQPATTMIGATANILSFMGIKISKKLPQFRVLAGSSLTQ